MGRPRLPEGCRRRSTSLTLAPETVRRLLDIQAEAGLTQQAWSLSEIVDQAVEIAHDQLMARAFDSGTVLVFGPETARDLGLPPT